MRSPPPPPRAAAAAASAAARRPRLGQVGGVGVAGGLAGDDADAGAPVAAGGQLLDPAVVEAGRGGPLVLDEHLGEVAAGSERGAERPLDHASSSTCSSRSRAVVVARKARLRSYRDARPSPASSAQVVAEGRRRRHRHRLPLGRGGRARHPPGRGAGRGGRRRRRRRRRSARARPRSACACSSTTCAPRAIGADGHRRGHAREGRGPAAHLHGVGRPTRRGLVAAGKVTRVIVDTERFLDKAN